jgi:hypothetical protein
LRVVSAFQTRANNRYRNISTSQYRDIVTKSSRKSR